MQPLLYIADICVLLQTTRHNVDLTQPIVIELDAIHTVETSDVPSKAMTLIMKDPQFLHGECAHTTVVTGKSVACH